MISELLDTAKFLLGFFPWILFLLLPTNSWDQLRGVVVICLAASVIFGWKELRKGFILQWASLLFFLFCVILGYGFYENWKAASLILLCFGMAGMTFWAMVELD